MVFQCLVWQATDLCISFCSWEQAQTFAQVLESDSDGSDEKAITAMGILNTLDTICTVMEDQKEVTFVGKLFRDKIHHWLNWLNV